MTPTASLEDPPGTGVRNVLSSKVGLHFHGQLTFEQWARIGHRVGRHANASLWWLGDWLVYGERMYEQRYRRAIALTGLDYQTLRNYATVARRFPLSRRRDKLSFQHHAEVCALSEEDRERWLDRAQRERWSRNELRRQLRPDRPPRGRTAGLLRLEVDPERASRWLRAATLCESELNPWIVATLDGAANGLLAPDIRAVQSGGAR